MKYHICYQLIFSNASTNYLFHVDDEIVKLEKDKILLFSESLGYPKSEFNLNFDCIDELIVLLNCDQIESSLLFSYLDPSIRLEKFRNLPQSLVVSVLKLIEEPSEFKKIVDQFLKML